MAKKKVGAQMKSPSTPVVPFLMRPGCARVREMADSLAERAARLAARTSSSTAQAASSK